MKWIPANVLSELDNIKTEEGILKDSRAFSKMVEHCKVGRQMDKIDKLLFGRRK